MAGEKTVAEVERERINVTSNNTPAKEPEKTDEENNENEEVNEENEEVTENEETVETEENEEDSTDKEETNEETVETKSVEKLEKTIARLQKRIDKTTGSNKDLKKQLDDANKALEAKKAEGDVVLTEDEVEKRATDKAKRLAADKEFVDTCNSLADAAAKIDKKFDTKVAAMSEDIGPIPSQMIGILGDLDNGGAVLAHLVNNLDEAEEIYTLSMARMATKLTKLSLKLETEAAEKKKKKISQVPPPNEPIGGGSKSPTILSDKDSMDEWVRKRNIQVEARRQARLSR